jgi:hypothetical protein
MHLYSPADDVVATTRLDDGPYPFTDYQVAGGWTAFRSNDDGVLIARSDAGTVAGLTGSHAHLLAVNDAGELIYRQGTGSAFVIPPGAAPFALPAAYPADANAGNRAAPPCRPRSGPTARGT